MLEGIKLFSSLSGKKDGKERGEEKESIEGGSSEEDRDDVAPFQTHSSSQEIDKIKDRLELILIDPDKFWSIIIDSDRLWFMFLKV